LGFRRERGIPGPPSLRPTQKRPRRSSPFRGEHRLSRRQGNGSGATAVTKPFVRKRKGGQRRRQRNEWGLPAGREKKPTHNNGLGVKSVKEGDLPRAVPRGRRLVLLKERKKKPVGPGLSGESGGCRTQGKSVAARRGRQKARNRVGNAEGGC